MVSKTVSKFSEITIEFNISFDLFFVEQAIIAKNKANIEIILIMNAGVYIPLGFIWMPMLRVRFSTFWINVRFNVAYFLLAIILVHQVL